MARRRAHPVGARARCRSRSEPKYRDQELSSAARSRNYREPTRPRLFRGRRRQEADRRADARGVRARRAAEDLSHDARARHAACGSRAVLRAVERRTSVMRNSQRVMLGLLGVIVGLMVVVAVWVGAGATALPQLSGERSTMTYDFTDFDGVDVDGQWRVTIERGDAWRVSVELPVEVVDQVRVRREGDTLNLVYEGPG